MAASRGVVVSWCTLVTVGLSLSLVGCAQSRLSHQPGLVNAWDRTQPFVSMAQAPGVSLILHTRHLLFGEPGESSLSKWWTKQKLHGQLRDVLDEFPFLAHAAWDASEAPYRLEIEATHAIRGSKTRSSLSSASKYILPTWEDAVIELDARLYRKTELLRTYEAVGSFHVKRHLLFLALPMLWGSEVPSETMEDTFRDLFLQIQGDAQELFIAEGQSAS